MEGSDTEGSEGIETEGSEGIDTDGSMSATLLAAPPRAFRPFMAISGALSSISPMASGALRSASPAWSPSSPTPSRPCASSSDLMSKDSGPASRPKPSSRMPSPSASPWCRRPAKPTPADAPRRKLFSLSPNVEEPSRRLAWRPNPVVSLLVEKLALAVPAPTSKPGSSQPPFSCENRVPATSAPKPALVRPSRSVQPPKLTLPVMKSSLSPGKTSSPFIKPAPADQPRVLPASSTLAPAYALPYRFAASGPSRWRFVAAISGATLSPRYSAAASAGLAMTFAMLPALSSAAEPMLPSVSHRPNVVPPVFRSYAGSHRSHSLMLRSKSMAHVLAGTLRLETSVTAGRVVTRAYIDDRELALDRHVLAA